MDFSVCCCCMYFVLKVLERYTYKREDIIYHFILFHGEIGAVLFRSPVQSNPVQYKQIVESASDSEKEIQNYTLSLAHYGLDDTKHRSIR